MALGARQAGGARRSWWPPPPEPSALLISWYYQPYLAPGNHALSLSEWSPLAPGLFDLRGVGFAAWTLAAFAIGGLAGMLVRRVVPAIVATLAVYAGLAFAAGLYLRQHYLAPLVTGNPGMWVSPGSAWVISQQWTTKGGRPVSQSVLGQVLQGAPPAGRERRGPQGPQLGAVPHAARLQAVDQLPAGQPVLAVPVHRSGMAPRALRAPDRSDDLARPPAAGLNTRPPTSPRTRTGRLYALHRTRQLRPTRDLSQAETARWVAPQRSDDSRDPRGRRRCCGLRWPIETRRSFGSDHHHQHRQLLDVRQRQYTSPRHERGGIGPTPAHGRPLLQVERIGRPRPARDHLADADHRVRQRQGEHAHEDGSAPLRHHR